MHSDLKITIDLPQHFNFRRTVYSHGWCSLPPFSVIQDGLRLERVLGLSSDRAALVSLSETTTGSLTIDVRSEGRFGKKEREETVAHVRTCLRLDDNYSDFYSAAQRYEEFRWVVRAGAGRLLRAPSVFEDVVKMICTTNCSWALTEIMVGNLCRKVGSEIFENKYTFPSPEALAECSEKFIRKEIRAGYRAPYLRELARNIVKGTINFESWRNSNLSTEDLFDEVRSVKGVGPYAAGNILKLLGRYEYLGIDSWCRKKFFEIHKKGRKVNDKVIERFYEPFEKWKGLFFWLDVTKHWYDKEFPF